MKRKVIVDTITLNGKEVNVYLCNRQAKCNKSIFCGKECTRTFKEKYAVLTGEETKLN